MTYMSVFSILVTIHLNWLEDIFYYIYDTYSI